MTASDCTHRILPITGASPNKGAPLVLGTQYFAEGLKWA